MRLFMVLILAMFMSGQAIGDEDPSGPWEEFSSPEGQFSALFPGHPTEQILPLDTVLGIVNMRVVMVQGKKGAFGVGYVRFSGEWVQLLDNPDAATINGCFDAIRDGIIENVQGKLISEKLISLGGHPGREVTVNVPHAAAVYIARMYIVHQRYYQISAVTPKGKVSSKMTQKFLASFQVTAY